VRIYLSSQDNDIPQLMLKGFAEKVSADLDTLFVRIESGMLADKSLDAATAD